MPAKRDELGCPDCGGSIFTTTHTPPKDDDEVVCAGCQNVLGTYRSLANKHPTKSITNILRGDG